MPKRLFRPVLLSACASLALACAAGAAAQMPPNAGAGNAASNAAFAAGQKKAEAQGGDWAAHLRRFEAAYFKANPVFAVGQGRHEFDGRLPDWSAKAIRQQIAWLEQQRKAAAAFADVTLAPPQRFERDYLLARIDGDLFWLRDAQQPSRNPAFYAGWLDPSVYLTRPYAPLATRMKAFIAYARAVPKAMTQMRANLKTPLPKTYVELGINSFGGYASFFGQDVQPIFAEVKDAALQAQ
ncbi:MAG: DUF885 family protein, partial [Solimonas sp.]